MAIVRWSAIRFLNFVSVSDFLYVFQFVQSAVPQWMSVGGLFTFAPHFWFLIKFVVYFSYMYECRPPSRLLDCLPIID